MKNIIALMMLFMCGCCVSSCDFTHTTDRYPIDSTLAGSVSYGYYRVEIEGSYDNADLDLPSKQSMSMSVVKVSDREVSLTCRIDWSGIEVDGWEENSKIVEVSIPKIPLSGKPYDVIFDHVSDDAKVRYNGDNYDHVKASVKGWVKNEEYLTIISRINRSQIPIPEYKCAFSINCVVGGKLLSLKITSKEDPQ